MILACKSQYTRVVSLGVSLIRRIINQKRRYLLSGSAESWLSQGSYPEKVFETVLYFAKQNEGPAPFSAWLA